MVSLRDSGGGSLTTSPFLFGSSSAFGSSPSSSSSTTTTTHFFNVLSASAGGELTTVQHYNDISRPKNTNIQTKNINREAAAAAASLVVLSKHGSSNRWGSFRERSTSIMESTCNKITNKKRAIDNMANADVLGSKEEEEKKKKDEHSKTPENKASEEKPLNISKPSLQKSETVVLVDARTDDDKKASSNISRAQSIKEKFLNTREKLSSKEKSKRTKVSRTFSLMPDNLKRNKFWSQINKSTDQGSSKLQDSERPPKVRLYVYSYYKYFIYNSVSKISPKNIKPKTHKNTDNFC